MKQGRTKLSRKQWYSKGGFCNPNLFRVADSKNAWCYFELT